MKIRARGVLVFVITATTIEGTTAGSDLLAQEPAQPQVAVTPATPAAPVTVGDLVAPIALYPDQLLGQVLTISTTPQEVLDLAMTRSIDSSRRAPTR
jgi:hypothetical protein